MRRARQNDGKVKKKMIIFLASFASVIFLFIIALGFHSVLFPIIDNINGEIDENYVEPVDKATGKANVLLLGVDKDGLRTDTIIVASYDLDKNAVNLLSIPRDTRMYIGRQYQKINAAHALSQNGKIKGPQGSIEAVTRLTGIPINYYVEFSCEAFRNTIDALGGVDIDVPQRMKYSDPVQDLYIDLQAGMQHLDGDKAEQLVRFRKYPRGDIQRVEMQQTFVKALAEQKLNITILTKLPDLFKTLQKDIETNFKVIDVMKYIPNLKELSPENINMYSLPGDFSGEQYSASYWIADIEETKTLISEVFGYDATNISVGPKEKSTASTNSQKKNSTEKNSTKTVTKTTEKKKDSTKKADKSQKQSDDSETEEVELDSTPDVSESIDIKDKNTSEKDLTAEKNDTSKKSEASEKTTSPNQQTSEDKTSTASKSKKTDTTSQASDKKTEDNKVIKETEENSNAASESKSEKNTSVKAAENNNAVSDSKSETKEE